MLPQADLMRALLNALIADVYDLMECRVTYVDTDPPDLDKARTGKPMSWAGSASQFSDSR